MVTIAVSEKDGDDDDDTITVTDCVLTNDDDVKDEAEIVGDDETLVLILTKLFVTVRDGINVTDARDVEVLETAAVCVIATADVDGSNVPVTEGATLLELAAVCVSARAVDD